MNDAITLHNWFAGKLGALQSYQYQRDMYLSSAEAEKAKIQNNIAMTPTIKSQNISSIDAQVAKIEQDLATKITSLTPEIKALDPIFSEMYSRVLSPDKNNQNTGGIYRIGTFFTYFVNNNRSRFLEDSLITNFQTYFYDKNSSVVAERMKKM